MTQPWTPEHVVSADLARRLVEEQFPELGARVFDPFGVGWDNTAYLVDGRWVFRFPRRAIAVDLIVTEARVLPEIVGALPLAVPVPRWLGRPAHGYPWPFAGYELLSGRSACSAELDASQRGAAAGPLGRFLAALHGIDAAGLGAPGDTIARADMETRSRLMIDRVGTLVTRGLIDDPAPLLRLVETAPRQPPAAEPRLCHGDLYARHLLVDDAALPCGVIDWGDVHLGNPAVDLAIARGFLPPEARGAFLSAYGPVADRAWEFARLRALFYGVATLLYGHDVGDAPMVREGRTGIDHALAG